MLVALMGVALAVSAQARVESLPAPVVNASSFEIVSNSRYSSHSGFTSSLPTQVLANVLWAMNLVPSFGSAYRELYVATSSNVYFYDPVEHVLSVHLTGNHRYSANSAFEVGIAVERYEEAGLAIQAGLLAGDAFWARGSGTVISCPMQFAANHANSNWSPRHPVRMVNVYGRMSVTGLTDSCVARSSDSTLPLPRTDGPDTFEVVLADLTQDTVFDPVGLTPDQVSQLLWAGYGVTPHMPIGRRGTTIPSAVANYYLTGHIYLVRDTAVSRYHNRLPPGTNLATSDHRLETITLGDRRDALRAACPRIPASAPVYIVLSVADTVNSGWGLIEAGFAAFQYLAQARILGLGGHLTAPLTVEERVAIRAALGLPGSEHPAIVFSTGSVLTGIEERGQTGVARLRTMTGLPVRIEYSLERSDVVRFTVSDLVGRTVCEWQEAGRVGIQSSSWSGQDRNGRTVPAGVYFVCLAAGKETERCRVVLIR